LDFSPAADTWIVSLMQETSVHDEFIAPLYRSPARFTFGGAVPRSDQKPDRFPSFVLLRECILAGQDNWDEKQKCQECPTVKSSGFATEIITRHKILNSFRWSGSTVAPTRILFNTLDVGVRSCAYGGNDGGPHPAWWLTSGEVSLHEKDKQSAMARTGGSGHPSLLEQRIQAHPNADITDAMGLSAGAIYRYVESKEALFDLVVRAGAGMQVDASKLSPPLVTPRPGATLAFLRETLKREGRIACLQTALSRPKVEDVADEFGRIVRELYAKTAQFRVGIKLLDRSALDWPELAELWSGHWRAGLVSQLSRYLDLRISQHLLSTVPDIKAWARFVIETVAFFCASPSLRSVSHADERRGCRGNGRACPGPCDEWRNSRKARK
jgi:AcrR family transcriptional regulator